LISLLVSVRHASEARAALDGGTDVLDIKAPERGPLGMPEVSTVADIDRVRREWAADQHVSPPPLSVALGEAREWLATTARSNDAPLIRVDYLKLGTAGLADAGVSWTTRYREAWDRVARVWNMTRSAKRVAVAYADHEVANAPSPDQVLRFALDEGWDGFLIDTFAKGPAGNLFDHLDETRLQRLCASARDRRLPHALAGQLSPRDIPRLRSLRPDLVGIRSAACAQGRRDGRIEARLVTPFRNDLNRPT
jgi:(5-formylfuran-3-yl)methyl phosphate synthase